MSRNVSIILKRHFSNALIFIDTKEHFKITHLQRICAIGKSFMTKEIKNETLIKAVIET